MTAIWIGRQILARQILEEKFTRIRFAKCGHSVEETPRQPFRGASNVWRCARVRVRPSRLRPIRQAWTVKHRVSQCGALNAGTKIDARRRRGSYIRVSVCSMRCDTRESDRPRPAAAAAAVLRRVDPASCDDNGGCRGCSCMWGQRAFYEQRESASFLLLLLTHFLPLRFLYAAPPLSFSLSPSSPFRRPLRSCRADRRERNYPFTPFVDAALNFPRFFLSLSFFRRFSIHSSSSAMSKPLPSSAVQFPRLRLARERGSEGATQRGRGGRPPFEIGGGREVVVAECRSQSALGARARDRALSPHVL